MSDELLRYYNSELPVYPPPGGRIRAGLIRKLAGQLRLGSEERMIAMLVGSSRLLLTSTDKAKDRR